MLPHVGELDGLVAAYEVAKVHNGNALWTDFLPPREHPLFLAVLRELVRIDLEAAWDEGRPQSLEEYLNRFPELARDREGLREIAFEEYRLRCQAGQRPSLTEYQDRYAIDTGSWSDLELGSSPSDGEQRSSHEEQAEILCDLYDCDPVAAQELAEAINQFPTPGSSFLGFQLVAELGRGTFGRVYLARQGDLANRYVALKVAADLYTESQTLAQLQHTHIVPIYSIHQAGALQAVCMPFLGTTTLAEVFKDIKKRDSVPASGKSLVQTLDARKSATHLAEAAESRGRVHDRDHELGSGENASASGHATAENLSMLARLTHVQAVLWIVSRVADGLAHAHAQGILHRDLKPANILLTDDGQPMLLDFNLSADTKLRNSASAALLGGTLPYMAPEHLEAHEGAARVVDARSDLYSLGIILYEMLAGRPPYEMPRGAVPELLSRMCSARRELPPDLRQWNKAVSPAVASIVQHCLEPDPGRRYQSSRELRDDLECQLADRPLRYAPEPSLTERAQKWARRHPRLTSSTSVGIVALAAVLGLGTALFLRGQEVARLEARDSLQVLTENLKTVRFLLQTPQVERQQLEDGKSLCRHTVERYRIFEAASWKQLPTVRWLEPAEQERLREDLGELLFLWAQADSWLVGGPASEDQRREQIDHALHLNGLAATCYSPGTCPPALRLQRVRLLRLNGRKAEAEDLEALAGQMPTATAQNRYLYLADQVGQGRWRAALPILRELSRQEPQNYSWWLVLGNCHAALGNVAEAAACYDLGMAMRPDAIWAYFNRGLLYLEHKQYGPAQADFEQVIHLQPDLVAGLFNRAVARYGLKDYQGALADLTHVLEVGTTATRVYFFRARVRAQLGDREGAQRDRAEGMRREPSDETDWIVRGVARCNSAPQEALTDFEKAIEINPRSRTGLQNKASVLSEKLNRSSEALTVLDQVVSLYPEYVPARAGRGVLLARMGKREAAHADARESLALTTQPEMLYQIAGIYSLTSQQEPDDRREALRLLGGALSKGFGVDLLNNDKDLDPIRNQPEFRRVVEAARALSKEK
jgi:serine/threonine protein kinase/tetratricopeptide (TPR) repeat protein